MHNSRCTIHNCGYFSVVTEKFIIDFVAANSVRHITSNCIASQKIHSKNLYKLKSPRQQISALPGVS